MIEIVGSKFRFCEGVSRGEFVRIGKIGLGALTLPELLQQRAEAGTSKKTSVIYHFDGNRVWEHKLGPFQDEFGANSSPVLAGELLISNEDHDIDSFLLAVDRETGETVWRTARDGITRSYSTPVIRTVDGRDHVIVAGSRQLIGYDLAGGQKRWWVGGLARVVIPVPAQTDTMLYVLSWTDGADPGLIYSMESWSDALKKYDTNGDSQISRDEALVDTVRSRFFCIDTDQDGNLDENEWEAYARVFADSKNAMMEIRPGGQGDVTGSQVKWAVSKAKYRNELFSTTPLGQDMVFT